jgi:hypothetical protein
MSMRKATTASSSITPRIHKRPTPSHAKETTIEEILSRTDGEHWFEQSISGLCRERRAVESNNEAQRQRARDVKMLRRHGRDDEHILRLAKEIADCRPQARCLSGFCSECMAANQNLFVAMTTEILDRSTADVSVVSIVDWKCRFAEGELSRDDDMFAHLQRKVREALTAAGITRAFGGFDISANEHAEDRFPPHYRPHAWLIVPTSQIGRGEHIFRSFFPRSATVKRPVVVKPFDGDPRGLAYALKTTFVRRISLPREHSDNGEMSRRNTRDRPLLARQKIELAVALDTIGLQARVFLLGLQMVTVNGRVRLKRID